MQDASKHQADHDDGADQHADRGQSAFASETWFAHSVYSQQGFGGSAVRVAFVGRERVPSWRVASARSCRRCEFFNTLVHRFIARSSRGCNYCPSSSRTGSACTRRFRGPRSELRRATSSYKWYLIACCSALNGSENDRPAFCFSTKSISASASSACRRFNLRCGNRRSSGSRA